MRKVLYTLCLTVLLGVIAAWVWSYQCQYHASVWFPSRTRVMMIMSCGRIQVAWGRSDLAAPPRMEFNHYKAPPTTTGLGVTSFWTWLGFDRFIDARSALVVVPHWLFVAIPMAV